MSGLSLTSTVTWPFSQPDAWPLTSHPLLPSLSLISHDHCICRRSQCHTNGSARAGWRWGPSTSCRRSPRSAASPAPTPAPSPRRHSAQKAYTLGVQWRWVRPSVRQLSTQSQCWPLDVGCRIGGWIGGRIRGWFAVLQSLAHAGTVTAHSRWILDTLFRHFSSIAPRAGCMTWST